MKTTIFVVLCIILIRLIVVYIDYRNKKGRKLSVRKKPLERDLPNNSIFEYIDFPGAEIAYERSLKDPPKIICSVCDEEITQEDIQNGKAHINYMVEGIGIDNMYFHKRCMNNKVLVDKNP